MEKIVIRYINGFEGEYYGTHDLGKNEITIIYDDSVGEYVTSIIPFITIREIIISEI